MTKDMLSFIGFSVALVMMSLCVGLTVHHARTCEKKWTQDLVINGDTGRAELRDIQVCK